MALQLLQKLDCENLVLMLHLSSHENKGGVFGKIFGIRVSR